MLIFIPCFLIFLWVIKNYLREHRPKRMWTEGFPIAFNLKLDPSSKAGKKYKIFFFIIFFLVPVILQFHNLKVFFRTSVYLKSNPETVIADDIKSHLLNFHILAKFLGMNMVLVMSMIIQSHFFLAVNLGIFCYWKY